MLHLLEILFRLERGEIPHLDYMTPLGAFAYLPIHGFMSAGYGVDQAVLWAQSAVAAGFLPMIWWAAWTRFDGLAAYGFGLLSLVLILALVHGQTVDAVSISMHYNRWAWALAYVAVALAVLPARGPGNAWIDGAILGFCIAALVMIKITYVVGLAPAILVALVQRHSASVLISAIVVGVLVAIGVTLWAGFGYWMAYLGDLRTVTGSHIRPNPSFDLATTLVAPAYFGGTVAALTAVIMLRGAGAKQGGLLVFLLLPGFAYITYQNFGNDPQWLALLGLLVIVLCNEVDPEAQEEARRLSYLCVVILAFAAPSFINLAYSPIRHALVDTEDYAPYLPGSERHAGFQTLNERANKIDGVEPLDFPGGGLEAYAELIERPEPSVFQNEVLPECEVVVGLPGWMDGMAKDIQAAGFGSGTRIFVADILSSMWIYNDQEPLTKGAPWYYGGLPGLDSADYLMVPLCPALPGVRRLLIEQLDDSGRAFEEVHRSPLYILYSVS